MTLAIEVREFLEKLGHSLQKAAEPKTSDILVPDELHIELTYRCDSKCVMCNIEELRHSQNGPDITLSDLKKFIYSSKILKSDPKFILLSGGEPWLHPEFIEILTFFKMQYKTSPILILTNLLNTEYILKKLKIIEGSIGFENISLGTSIDGIAAAHDDIRGISGAYDSLLLSANMIKMKFPDLPLSFNFTLLPQNISQLFDVFKWGRDTANHVSFQMLVQKLETPLFKWDQGSLEALNVEINRIIDFLWKSNSWDFFEPKQIFDDFSLMFLLLDFHYMHKYLMNPERFFPNCPCGQKFVMINPEGNVYLCPVHKDLVVGNINKNSLEEIWNGKACMSAQGFFSKRSCHCWLSCTNSYMIADAFFPVKEKILMEFLK